MTRQTFDQVLQEASVDPSAWPRVLQSIGDTLGAVGSNFLPLSGHTPHIPFSPALAEGVDRYVREGWLYRDERVQAMPKLLRVGTAVDQDYTTAEQMARSPYYQELLAPLNLKWFGGLGVRAGEDIWCLTVQRTPAQGFFTPDDEKRLLALQLPLTRTTTLARLVGHARADSVLDAFEAMRQTCFLLDSLGRVIRMTEGARLLLGRDLVLARTALRPTDRARAPDLARLIAAALWADIDPASPFLRPVALRRAGRRPLLVTAQPLHGAARSCFGGASVAVIVTDLDVPPAPSERGIRDAFGLTASEARLVVALARCHDLRQAARDCGLGYETARTYVKAVLLKTGTRNQADLIGLVARFG